jgi:hypothetical protein
VLDVVGTLWSDVDHGVVDITRAFNRPKPTEIKGTKSTPRAGLPRSPISDRWSHDAHKIMQRCGHKP